MASCPFRFKILILHQHHVLDYKQQARPACIVHLVYLCCITQAQPNCSVEVIEEPFQGHVPSCLLFLASVF